ncbi:NADPH-dependent ferric siderophore reductase, contains FAD-binding and SIP domains [Mucilaginibacter lappiensis]|nr:NADPH-dependent ferric siderophore reductase, contains FAD-binding and SIP domains [Mucilaginibacter lappiensis]
MNTVVCGIQETAPHLRRISLKHELLKQIGPLAPGGHFKVFIPSTKDGQAFLPDMSSGRAVWPNEKIKPHIRTYTVRSLDRITGILDVEFVLHGDIGPGSAWAGNASIGDSLGIGIKLSGKIREPSDWYLFAGDETALPAISAMLENLPAETTGLALLEVERETDTFYINTKGAIDICWLFRNGVPPEQSDLILYSVKNLVLPESALKSRYAWIAGEENMVRIMRKYAIEQLGLNREELHATVYWKAGFSEDDYHQIRRAQ